MNLRGVRRTWIWTGIALATLVSLVALAPHWGFTEGVRPLLWSEGSPSTPPRTVPAPDWVSIARDLKPAVVNISTRRVEDLAPQGRLPGTDPFEGFFRDFFGVRPRREVRSLGSGFIINANGDIVTNNHVVDGATDIRVTLSDGREMPAKIAGRDPKTDLALLKAEATGLPTIPLGDSSRVQIGEPVMAIGNPFGLEQTVTTGIVSATGRVIGEGPYDDFIQTDASINPGNSGGPLINTRGQAIGIDTAIFSQSGGSIGIGFAIPINLAKSVVTQLAASGHVDRGWLGVSIQPVTPELARSFGLPAPRGALVSSVADGAPAMKAGIQPGDVITEYNSLRVDRSTDLPRAVAETPIGRRVPLVVVRQGRTMTLTATIAKLAEEREQVASATSPGTSLGLSAQSLTPALARERGLAETRGVLVRGVEAGSRADRAGLEPGDVILEVDHRGVASATDMRRLVEQHRADTPLLMLVRRDDATFFVVA
jgi:serine protease Do